MPISFKYFKVKKKKPTQSFSVREGNLGEEKDNLGRASK